MKLLRFYEIKNNITGALRYISVPYEVKNGEIECVSDDGSDRVKTLVTPEFKKCNLKNFQPKDLEAALSSLGVNEISELNHITKREMSIEEFLTVPEWIELVVA